MKIRLIIAMAALSLVAVSAQAQSTEAQAPEAQSNDIGKTVQKGGDSFSQDANEFGKSVKTLNKKVHSEILSGATQMVTGPSGEAIMLVGDVTGEAASAIASQYKSTQGALKCVANDPLNPFKDGGCVVQYGGETLLLAVNTAGDGTHTIIIASAEALSDVFNGFSRILNETADATGRMQNPLGAFFVLTYHITKAGETVIRFAMVDVIGRTVLVLTDEGANLVAAPLDALYDVVTLHWKRAGVKIINLPLRIVNTVANVPLRIIFGKKKKDLLLRTLSPLGRFVNRTLGISQERAAELNSSRTGLVN